MERAAGPSNADAANLLERYGALLELSGESPFRVRAYHRAAESVRHLDAPLADVARSGALREIPGVGEGIAAILQEYLQRGTFSGYDDLTARFPHSLLDILALPGVGVKTVMKLYNELGIATLPELEAAAVSGALRATKGFGAKLEATVLSGLETLAGRSGRMPIGEALPLGRSLAAALRQALPGRVALAGSARRFTETVGDIDIVVETTDPDATVARIAAMPIVGAVVDRFESGLRVRLQSGIEADIFLTPPQRFGATLVRATGPAAHVQRLAPLPEAADEAAVYAARGLPWIPPELRLGGEEFDRYPEIPSLVVMDDIRGELHCHSTWSDGAASIADMAAAAALRGYAFLGITDHSHGLGIASGLDVARLRAQRAEIAAVSGPVDLLAGSEVEVRRDGSLDFDDATLAALDVVVASLHVGLRQPREQLMDRLLGVLRNPNVDIIAHPSGRLIERRPPGDFDWPTAFAVAAETGTALEINADPMRLDLKHDLAAAALRAGCTLTINCDAHHPDGFTNMEYGIAVARQAWARPEHIINTWSPERLHAWLTERGSGAGP
ncbi:MAG: histidinol-phosphatase [Thermomicrobiales bacterium]|nr:histidinol-phosphatase [Thermomicrobiales bacterium]